MASSVSSSRVGQQPKSPIVCKSARGVWLHPDHLVVGEGITYAVKYVGRIDVNTSMKMLNFDTRSAIAKECINRVCESAGQRLSDRKRRSDPKVASVLAETPNLDKAGVNVQLTITSVALKLSDLDTGKAVFVHDMPNISFASGGDAETIDFVAYVAKDKSNARSCFVLECGGGIAQSVITTIGQAFELRFKEFLKNAPTGRPEERRGEEVEYYNDLPGKRPPAQASAASGPASTQQALFKAEEKHKKESISSNLIDFSTEVAAPSRPDREYVNGNVPNPRDPFDMSPFAIQAAAPTPLTASAPSSAPSAKNTQLLLREDWYHGPISRRDAELLLVHDGDFLVRESQASPGQYVLTGMQAGSKKHLLLVDPEGVVRTKDRAFDSVSHLIDFHRNNNLPIISAESALRLKTPVSKRR